MIYETMVLMPFLLRDKGLLNVTVDQNCVLQEI